MRKLWNFSRCPDRLPISAFLTSTWLSSAPIWRKSSTAGSGDRGHRGVRAAVDLEARRGFVRAPAPRRIARRSSTASALHPPQRAGAAVFHRGPRRACARAAADLNHNKVLHERVLLAVRVEDIPHVSDAQRIRMSDLGDDFHRMIVHYGFRTIDLRAWAVRRAAAWNSTLETSFFLSRQTWCRPNLGNRHGAVA